ncbi:MAG: SDR family NAD(P)-dependent oxidoreductase [Rhodospirillales bacterium]|nr:SDR family NAD(P)-dependent oxidoreductase [Rhodospirillales bacterium]
MRNSAPKSILITGASSGIGEALAHLYAQPGVTLFLSGRNRERLETTAQACRESGAFVQPEVIDVADRDAMARWITAADDAAPLDLVIANAGIASNTSHQAESAEKIRDIFAINLAGVLNTAEPAVERMLSRKKGQVALMSSLSAFRGMPSAPAYAASKAAVKSYGDGLRGALRGDGIKVSVICPGFVTSRITKTNRFPMPFLMDADKAAQIIKRGLHREKGLIAFPLPTHLIIKAIAALPMALGDRLLGGAPRKE